MANFDLANLALQAVCPNNVIKVDDTGYPSVLVYIPKFKNSDVLKSGNDSTHPAFIVNGKEIPGFYYSKYQNRDNTGVAYSLPGVDPTTSINFDTARAHCEAKGAGWHLSTNAEWAAIALWCKANGFLPYGNNDYGKDTRETTRKAIPTYLSGGKTGRVATGTGPVTWSHDKTMSGIWDMNGNVYEWQGGIRTVYGELQILANNDAADPNNPQNEKSACWKAIEAATGNLVAPECSVDGGAGKPTGKTVKLNYSGGQWIFSTTQVAPEDTYKSCQFYKVKADESVCEAAQVLLRALALLPDTGVVSDEYDGDYAYWNNGAAERCVYRGGNWNYGSYAGVFYVHGSYSRGSAYGALGFRSAFIPNIG